MGAIGLLLDANGIVVQLITKYCVSVKVIDHHVMQRLSGLALDYLVPSHKYVLHFEK